MEVLDIARDTIKILEREKEKWKKGEIQKKSSNNTERL